MSPEPQSAAQSPRTPSRADKLREDLERLLLHPDDVQRDGAELLPDYASAEPGALLHEMHEVWTRQGGTGGNAHSFAKLKEACQINSLQHKLKGRLPMEGKNGLEEARDLSKAMLQRWEPDGSPFLPKKEANDEAAGRLARILFGPIYGLDRKEIRIVESPGMNAATFMREQRAREGARAIVIPVTDRAMFGPDPAHTLDGTRLSLAQYLGDDPEPRRGAGELAPMIIYALRSEPPNITKDYVRYIYERSFLSTLFRLVQQTSEKRWKVEYVGKRFPAWNDLENRLWVCVSPANQRADDIIPVRVPENWRDVVEGGIGPVGKFGLTVVCMCREPGSAKAEDMTLEYWKYSKDDRAFSEIGRPVDKHVEEAHRALLRVVFDLVGARGRGQVGGDDGGSSERPRQLEGTCEPRDVVKEVEGEKVALGTWTIVSAEAFMRDKDLIDGGAKHACPGG